MKMINYQNLIDNEYNKAVAGILPEWYESKEDQWYRYVKNLPGRTQITYLVVILHNQVINGGFHQYYANGYGQFSKLTIKALVEIECYKRAKLLTDALTLVNSDNYSDEVFRMKILKKEIELLFKNDSLNEPLSVLDNYYYDMVDEDIEEFLGNHLGIY